MNWFAKTSTSESAEGANEEASLSEKEVLQKKIFVSTFAMIAKIAGVDGSVSKSEVEAVERFMDQVLHLDKARKTFAIKVFNKARKSTTTFRQHAEDYRVLLKDKPEMYEWMVDMLARFSLADKTFDATESEILSTACEIFGVPEERYKSVRARLREQASEGSEASAGLEEHFQALGCSPSDSFEVVEKKFGELKLQYSPERIDAIGLPEEFRAVAEQKMKEMSSAYQKLRQHFGK